MSNKTSNRHGFFSFSLLAAVLTAPALSAQTDAPATLRAQALSQETSGQTTAAEAIWDGIAKADPRDVEALAHMGLLESRQEHFETAIGYYRRAAAINPNFPGLQMNMGLALFKSAQFPDAIRVFRSELNQHPGDQRLIILLGMSHYGMNDYLVANPYLRRATENEPGNIPLRLTLAHSCIASGQYECVLNVQKETLALHGESAEMDMLAAEASDRLHDRASAEQALRGAIRLDPAHANAHFALGYLLWTQGKWAEAAGEFQQELQNDPNHKTAQSYLADAQRQLRDASNKLPPQPAPLQELISSVENPAP